MLLTATLLFVTGICAPLPHDPGLSSLRVLCEGDALVVHVAFANADFRGAVAIDADGNGTIDAAELAAAMPLLEREVAAGFLLRIGDLELAPVLREAHLAENDDIELTMLFPDRSVGATLTVPFLDRLSRGHRCYAAVVRPDESIVTDALLSPTACEFPLPALAAPASGFGQAGRFVVLGVEHILLGFDHLAFLLALLIAGVTWRRALATITAFTVAHSITLVAAATGVVGLPSLLVEATIAASIVWVAAMNLLPRRAAAMHRWPFAFGFGLVHGFGFAGVLADLNIGGSNKLVPLLSFNVGVEIGQLAFALVVVPLLWWLARGHRAQSLLSIGVGLAGVFWFVERVAG